MEIALKATTVVTKAMVVTTEILPHQYLSQLSKATRVAALTPMWEPTVSATNNRREKFG
jgi:hypothetical protein